MNIAKFVVPLLLLAGVSTARASVSLTLETPNQTAVPGQTLTFLGNVSNFYDAPVDLNQIAITLNGPFSIETSVFFDASAPLSVEAQPESTGMYPWFTVTVNNPYPDALGIVTGTVSILGGVQGPGGYDPNTQDLLGSIGFSVNVMAAAPTPPPTPPVSGEIPEPSTWALFSAGGALLWWMKGRGRKNSRWRGYREE